MQHLKQTKGLCLQSTDVAMLRHRPSYFLKQSQDLQQSLKYQAVYFAGIKMGPANVTEDHYLGEWSVSNTVNSYFMLKKVSIQTECMCVFIGVI